MILNSTLKSIRVVLGEAKTTTDCDVTASWGDYAGPQFLPGAADIVSNGTTPVTVVAAPALDIQRLVQEITVFNADTVPHTVILQLDNNSTIRVFRHQEIPVGGMLIYSPSAIGDVVNAPPAVLLETGTIGEKISGLPAFSALVGPELFPIDASATTQAISAANLYASLFSADALSPFPMDATAGVTAWSLVLGAGAGNAAHPVPGSVSMGAGTAGTGANNDGGLVNIFAGNGAGTGGGGVLELSSGNSGSGATGDGGAVTVTAGNSVATAGAGGAINLKSGTGTTASGDVNAQSADNAGPTGGAFVFSGNNSGTGISGDAGAGTGNTTSGTSGACDLYTGDSAAGASGPCNTSTGAANGADAGNVNFSPGSVASGNGNGGDVVFNGSTGHGTGRQGLVLFVSGALPTADPTVSGALWVDPVTHLVHLSP